LDFATEGQPIPAYYLRPTVPSLAHGSVAPNVGGAYPRRWLGWEPQARRCSPLPCSALFGASDGRSRLQAILASHRRCRFPRRLRGVCVPGSL